MRLKFKGGGGVTSIGLVQPPATGVRSRSRWLRLCVEYCFEYANIVYLASYPGPPFNFACGGPGSRKYVILDQRECVHGDTSFYHAHGQE